MGAAPASREGRFQSPTTVTDPSSESVQRLNGFPVPRWYGILNRLPAMRDADGVVVQRPASGGSSGTVPRNLGWRRG